MYIDKIIKKEVITLFISVGLLLIVFIGVSFASFFKIDEGKDNVVETGDLAISFCNDSSCDTTYENIGQVIGTTKQDGTSVPSSIYPYPNDGTYSNATPYIFKVTNTGSMKATITIKLKEDTDFLPSGNYSEYSRLTDLYANHLKVAIRKKVLASGLEYQMGDANLDGIVNQKDAVSMMDYYNEEITYTNEQIKLADLDGDGEVTMNDLSYIYDILDGGNTSYEKMYISSFNTLSNNIIYSGDKIAPGESATYFLWLYLDKTTPNQAQKTYFVGNLDIQGEFIPDNLPFNIASWSSIISNVKSGNISAYKVGDTKEVDLGTLGKHNVRIANISTPSECSTSDFSQTACGFVLEFEDAISMKTMNSTLTNVGGWPSSEVRTYLNDTVYNSLPSELKEGIISTKVVSGHGGNETSNLISNDKLYLLAPKEIYSNYVNTTYDSAISSTRQMDYYASLNITMTNYHGASKKYNGSNTWQWLRTAVSNGTTSFCSSGANGDGGIGEANSGRGISPVFRIG